jgi:hypothetical protein
MLWGYTYGKYIKLDHTKHEKTSSAKKTTWQQPNTRKLLK